MMLTKESVAIILRTKFRDVYSYHYICVDGVTARSFPKLAVNARMRQKLFHFFVFVKQVYLSLGVTNKGCCLYVENIS